MNQYQFIGAGSYTNASTVTAQNVPLNAKADLFVLRDLTNWGSSVSALIEATWNASMADGAYIGLQQSAANAISSARGTSGGFTFIDKSKESTSPALVSTGLNSTTFVVSMASTAGLSVGDIVRIINPVGMYELGGITFAITSIIANTSITLGYAATAKGAGGTYPGTCTSLSVRKVSFPNFVPKVLEIAHITQAVNAKVYFFRPHDFVVGEKISFTISALYGMKEISFVSKQSAATVIAVTNTAAESSVTLDLNTLGYTAFAYPSGLVVNIGKTPPATCYHVGSGPIPSASPPGVVIQPTDNKSQFVMNIGLSVVGAANAYMEWRAYKSDYFNLSNQ